MAGFDDALGRGPEGSTYRAPVPRKRTVNERVRAWLWYRWDIGHRPAPAFESDRAGRSRPRRHRT